MTGADATCSNWTSSADGQGGAMVGHHDLTGNTNGPNLWNNSHMTPGCAPANCSGSAARACFTVSLSTDAKLIPTAPSHACAGRLHTATSHRRCVECCNSLE